MMKKTFNGIFAAVFLMASATTWASHCPAEMKKIDEALAGSPQLSEAQMADVKKLRTEGELLHKAGKHQESLNALGKALGILGMEGSSPMKEPE